MANITRTPTTGSIAFTGGNSYFLNSGDSKLIFTGYAPAVNPGVIPVPSGQISFTGKLAYRLTGIWFTGYPVTLLYGDVAKPTTDSLTFSGFKPELINTSPTQIIKLPSTVPLTFTGTESALNVLKPTPDKVALTFTTYAPATDIRPLVDHPRYPFFARLSFTGNAVTVDVAHSGVTIQNTTATTDVPVNYQIDDRTGFKVKVKKALVEEYTGHLVRPDSLDKRSEQEFLRSKREQQKGAQRPDDTGEETYVDDLYPDGVSQDDL